MASPDLVPLSENMREGYRQMERGWRSTPN